MTELAYVRATGGPDAPPDGLEDAIRRRSGVPTVRVVVRARDGSVLLEPFVASASVAALLGIPRKLDVAVAILRATAFEARRTWDEVLVVRRREGAPEAPIRSGELAAALTQQPVTVRVDDIVRRYRAEGAEVERHDGASRYVATFAIAARTDREAETLLRESVAEEGRVVAVASWQVLDVEAGVPGVQRID